MGDEHVAASSRAEWTPRGCRRSRDVMGWTVCCNDDDGVLMIRHIVSCSYDHTVRVWAVGSWQQEAILAGHSDFVNGLDVSRDGRYACMNAI